ncbi:glycosyltransferase [Ammoniphilus sp. YIM 78166]|uniref:glycosyltransferase n=1 Tax=Ammoniphilus sp. YIM 78166 TaxID=1644106 RepID=UPI00107039C2|nr:glycosyltransferase [Ammoniphilus sp. YIM 78166]
MEKVSVIIPVYNHEKFIAETIDSVLDQSHRNTEIIVVNDGSTDGTKEVLHGYKDKILMIEQANAGPSAARNHGLRKATGKFICFLDSDDKFYPSKLERQLQVFRRVQKVGLVHAGATVTKTNNQFWYRYIPRPFHSHKQQIVELLRSNHIVCSTVMVRRELFSRVGYFNESYPRHQDYDMWLRLLAHCPFGSVPEALILYRWHEQNISRETDKAALRIMKEEAAKRFRELGKE